MDDRINSSRVADHGPEVIRKQPRGFAELPLHPGRRRRAICRYCATQMVAVSSTPEPFLSRSLSLWTLNRLSDRDNRRSSSWRRPRRESSSMPQSEKVTGEYSSKLKSYLFTASVATLYQPFKPQPSHRVPQPLRRPHPPRPPAPS